MLNINIFLRAGGDGARTGRARGSRSSLKPRQLPQPNKSTGQEQEWYQAEDEIDQAFALG